MKDILNGDFTQVAAESNCHAFICGNFDVDPALATGRMSMASSPHLDNLVVFRIRSYERSQVCPGQGFSTSFRTRRKLGSRDFRRALQRSHAFALSGGLHSVPWHIMHL